MAFSTEYLLGAHRHIIRTYPQETRKHQDIKHGLRGVCIYIHMHRRLGTQVITQPLECRDYVYVGIRASVFSGSTDRGTTDHMDLLFQDCTTHIVICDILRLISTFPRHGLDRYSLQHFRHGSPMQS